MVCFLYGTVNYLKGDDVFQKETVLVIVSRKIVIKDVKKWRFIKCSIYTHTNAVHTTNITSMLVGMSNTQYI